MKHYLFILGVSLSMWLTAEAQLPEFYTINVLEAGSFENEFLPSSNAVDYDFGVAVVGDLNGDDIMTIRLASGGQMRPDDYKTDSKYFAYPYEKGGVWEDSNEFPAEIWRLDLRQAQIVGGGSPYFYEYEIFDVIPSVKGPRYMVSNCLLNRYKTENDVIGKYMFYLLPGLNKILLPRVKRIEPDAFMNCFALKEVLVNEGVVELETDVFHDCFNLKKVSLPSTLKSLGERPFHGVKELETLMCASVEPPTTPMSAFLDDCQVSSCELIVPVGSKAKYEADAVWSMFKEIKEMDFGAVTEVENISMKIDKGEECYTIDGKRVQRLSSSGVVVKNGKKEAVKR